MTDPLELKSWLAKMRLFVSYARVDKPYCIQIVDILDAHEIWYDHRIQVGQDWWQVIVKEIEECDGFVYLISPESLASTYCQREFALARKYDKPIFPVIIHNDASIPEELSHIHYADLTGGLTPRGVKELLNAIHMVERNGGHSNSQTTQEIEALDSIANAKPSLDPVRVIEEVSAAMEEKQYDHAVFLLKQAKDSGLKARFLNIEALLHQAEAALEKQTYEREAEREYRPIVRLVQMPEMRSIGCKAFESFRQHFPDYDPDSLASVCSTVLLPELCWCDISEGEVTVHHEPKSVTYYVNPFRISKFPVTNAQFQAFIDANDGYNNPDWWNFSPEAKTWRQQNTDPLPPNFAWGDHPRGNVNWYEAMAFCAWITYKTGLCITLPTEQQWQRAAQGDDWREYPWGSKFDKTRANTRESSLRMTTKVGLFQDSLSPFGVFDMSGNVWEWCINLEYKTPESKGKTSSHADDKTPTNRAVRGGSFISVAQRAKTTFSFYLNPLHRYASIGFRLICTEGLMMAK